MLTRHLTRMVMDAIGRAAVVHLGGPRQSGKSTLVERFVQPALGASLHTFDDLDLLASASIDPSGFVDALRTPVVIDEVQRCPALLLPIKARVDRERRPGSFVLTGSASILELPRIADALVGRVELLTLHPFAQSERDGIAVDPIASLFDTAPPSLVELAPCDDLDERVVTGGFPEAVTRAHDALGREAWFAAYTKSLLARDVRDLAAIEGLLRLPDLLRFMAARTATLSNQAEVSRTTGIAATTLKRYEALLEAVHLIARLPAWSTNAGKRLARSPKVFVTDSGVAAYLRGEDGRASVTGPLLETFVHAELTRLLSWSRVRARLSHLRTPSGIEVDFVLEAADGRCVGIEVKSSATIRTEDFRGLRYMQELLGERFVRGIVLHRGRRVLPFGAGLVAAPVHWLWDRDGHAALRV